MKWNKIPQIARHRSLACRFYRALLRPSVPPLLYSSFTSLTLVCETGFVTLESLVSHTLNPNASSSRRSIDFRKIVKTTFDGGGARKVERGSESRKRKWKKKKPANTSGRLQAFCYPTVYFISMEVTRTSGKWSNQRRLKWATRSNKKHFPVTRFQ